MAGNNIDFELLLKDEKFIAAMAKATAQVKKLNSSVKKTQTIANKSFKAKNVIQFGAALVGVSTAALAARKAFQVLSKTITSSIKDFAKFEKGMLSVRTLLDETSFSGKTAGEGFKQMGKDMTKVLQNIPIDAHDATKALFDITSAQISAADATGVLTAAGKLAVAGNAKVSTTTAAVVKSIVSFGLEAGDATNIAAKFFTAQKLGLTTVEELASGIGTVAANAAQMGLSMDETLAAIVGATRGGLSARRAFVGLGATLKSISNPGDKAAATAKEFGIEMSKAGIAAKGGIIPFLIDMQKKLKGNTTAFGNLIASARGRRFAGSLLTESGQKGAIDSLDALGDGFSNTKTLTDNYAIAVEGLDNKWTKFTSNLDIVKRELVTGLAPAFSKVLDNAVDGLQDLFEELQTPEAEASIAKLGRTITSLARAINELIPSMGKFAGFLEFVAEKARNAAKNFEFVAEALSRSEGAKSLEEIGESGLGAIAVLGEMEESLKTLSGQLDLQKSRGVNAVDPGLARKVAELELAVAEQQQVVLKENIRVKRAISDETLKGIKEEQAARASADKDRLESLKKVIAQDKLNLDSTLRIASLKSDENSKLQNRLTAESKSINVFADRAIANAKLIGLTKLQIEEKVHKNKIDNIQTAIDETTIGALKGNQAIEALERSFQNTRESREDAARKKKNKKDVDEAKKAADETKAYLASLAVSGLSTLSSGTKTQGSLREASTAAQEAQASVDKLPKPDPTAIKLAEKNIAATEKVIEVLQRRAAQAKGISKSNINFDIKQAKKRLSDDKKVLNKSTSQSDKRNKAIEAGLEDVKTANESVSEATKARDSEARGAVLGGLAAGVGAVFGPLAGQLAGPLLEGLTGSKEDATAFITSLTDQIPVVIDALVDNAPAIIIALVDAIPKVVEALIQAGPKLVIALVKAAPDIALAIVDAIALSMAAVAVQISKDFNAIGVGLLEILGLGPDKKQDVTQEDIAASENSNVLDTRSREEVNEAIRVAVEAEGKVYVPPPIVVKTVNVTEDDDIGDLGTFAATGGIITGAGNRDTVPAVLTPGELVIDRTTGPRLNKFLDSVGAQGGSTDSSGASENREILAKILSEVLKPVQVQSTVEFNGDALAEIILDLNRREARLA